MDYSIYIGLVAEIIEVCFPITLIFGISGKLYRLATDMIFNRKVEM